MKKIFTLTILLLSLSCHDRTMPIQGEISHKIYPPFGTGDTIVVTWVGDDSKSAIRIYTVAPTGFCRLVQERSGFEVTEFFLQDSSLVGMVVLSLPDGKPTIKPDRDTV